MCVSDSSTSNSSQFEGPELFNITAVVEVGAVFCVYMDSVHLQ